MSDYRFKTISQIVEATITDDTKDKVRVTRNGRQHVRRYKRALKVQHAFSTLDMLKENISKSNTLLKNLIAKDLYA